MFFQHAPGPRRIEYIVKTLVDDEAAVGWVCEDWASSPEVCLRGLGCSARVSASRRFWIPRVEESWIPGTASPASFM